MKKFLLIILYPLTGIFYWLGGFVPRRANRWVFGSYGDAFNDNSKHLFIYVTENNPGIEAVWITGSQKVVDQIRRAGGKSYLRWSWRGLITALTARFWFVSAYVSDINYYCSRSAVLANLWHGIPLKKIEFDIESGPLERLFKRPSLLQKLALKPAVFRRPQFVLTTAGGDVARNFESAFRVDGQQCLAFGYPRTDGFFRLPEDRMKSLERWESHETLALIAKIRGFRDCLIYMPTWRDAKPDFISGSGWDFPCINQQLVEREILLIVKLHAATPANILASAKGLSNIHLMSAAEDPYSVLPMTSALVSDYSSIIFDYLLLDKPIFYYPFDLDEYRNDCRGMYHEYAKMTAGPYISSPLELVASFLGHDVEDFAEDRRRLKERLFSHADQFAAARIVEKFKGLA